MTDDFSRRSRPWASNGTRTNGCPVSKILKIRVMKGSFWKITTWAGQKRFLYGNSMDIGRIHTGIPADKMISGSRQ